VLTFSVVFCYVSEDYAASASSTETEAPADVSSASTTAADNDIGNAVGVAGDARRHLTTEQRLKFITPWRPSCEQPHWCRIIHRRFAPA